ncbi:MAG: glycosyltransferase [Bacteroidia bacterium]|nr:glycosyltransferase [Bacteroidia bacterium]
MSVSVIIPCYNVADCLEPCLQSVFNQQHKELEVICVDNNSTDSTLQKLDALKEKFQELSVLSEKKQGAPAARNKGLEKTVSQYTQFLDADDQLLPEKISSQLATGIQNDFPDIVFSDYTRVNVAGEKKIFHTKKKDAWEALLSTKMGVTSALLFKTEAVKKAGGWNEELKSSQEYDLIFRILKNGGTVVFSPGNFTNVYDRPGFSISTTNKKQNWERYALLRMDILKYIEEQKINPSKISVYRQLAFDALRILYAHNAALAKEYFKKYFTKEFVPQVSASTGKMYKTMFAFFGFTGTEKIRKVFGK